MKNGVIVKLLADSTDISMEVLSEKFPESEDVHVKEGTERSSVVVFDEVHIKQEVKVESVEQLAPGSPNYEGLDNCINSEMMGPSECVLCDSCWTYCKDADELKDHQEASSVCKQYKNGGLSLVEDKSDESCKIRVLQMPRGTVEAERCTETNPGDIRSESNINPFVEPNEINKNIESSSGKKRYICNKTFSLKCDINRRHLNHTIEHPFSCVVCNQTFTRKGDLNRHKLKHTGERPFSCDVCNQTFTKRSDLNRHKIKHIKHTGERPFSCDICNQTFTQKSNLNGHKLKHTGERPFSCNVCSQTFAQKGYLNKHKLKHTGERPFSCDICIETFTQKSNLNRHKLKHTGQRPFYCDVCNQTFTQKGDLNRHKLIHIRLI